jgi:hypothetical protein
MYLFFYIHEKFFSNQIILTSVTGRRQTPDYVTDTETKREYQNPNVKTVDRLKHIEENRHGRYAYTPNRIAPNGICKF